MIYWRPISHGHACPRFHRTLTLTPTPLKLQRTWADPPLEEPWGEVLGALGRAAGLGLTFYLGYAAGSNNLNPDTLLPFLKGFIINLGNAMIEMASK